MHRLHTRILIISTWTLLTALAPARLAMAADPKPAAKTPTMPQNWHDWAWSKAAPDIALVKQIEGMEWWKACIAWGRESRNKTTTRRGAALRDYLVDYKYINGVDLANVRDQIPEVGQTTCGVFAVLGQPDKMNRTTRANSQTAQIVFGQKNVYVYTLGRPNDDNGIVTSVQH